MVSSLIGPQYHDDQFWIFTESSNTGGANDFNTAVVPAFSDQFQVGIDHGHLLRTVHKLSTTKIEYFP